MPKSRRSLIRLQLIAMRNSSAVIERNLAWLHALANPEDPEVQAFFEVVRAGAEVIRLTVRDLAEYLGELEYVDSVPDRRPIRFGH